MLGFRKPQRRLNRGNARRADPDSDDEDGAGGGNGAAATGDDADEDEESVEAVQSRIARLKEKQRGGRGRAGKKGLTAASAPVAPEPGKKSSAGATLLSFGDDEEADSVFQVKKSTQSRRIMKQKKAERRAEKESRRRANDMSSKEGSPYDDDEDEEEGDGPRLPREGRKNVIEEADIKFKDTLPVAKGSAEPASWTLSGREAEALHMEEEDESDEEADGGAGERKASAPSEPLRDMLQSGVIPDAAAIHAARKRRQAARERGGGQPDQDYVPLKKDDGEKVRRGRRNEADDDSGEDDGRISFMGVRSDKRDRQLRRSELNEEEHHDDDDEDDDDREEVDFEEQQLRKAMGQSTSAVTDLAMTAAAMKGPQAYPGSYDQAVINAAFPFAPAVPEPAVESAQRALKKPVSYNLQGIKARLKDRLASMNEVHRRHESDADRATDDFIQSQSEIEKLQRALPDLAERHRFYQDLRGYVTDLVECFGEKIINIAYMEEKLNKSREQMVVKLMERRREDVRDQMMELSNKPASAAVNGAADAGVAEAARQRRSAEREGRRRRRQQARANRGLNQGANKHNDGESSDDEMTSLELATLRKTKTDVESQARQTLSDVIDDFGTIAGVKERMEAWKIEDPDSYTDAYVSLCLPKVFSPLVRLQMLFWNPLEEKSKEVEEFEWHKSLLSYHWSSQETEESLAKDPDRRLVSVVVEKVVLPKMTGLLKCAYDPLSSTQTKRLTQLAKRLAADYPTLRGDSRQMREFLTAAKDKLKSVIDADPYIPIGYAGQVAGNPNGPHSAFVSRQFWSAYKLFSNILQWHGLLGDNLLAEYALKDVLNKYLLLAIGMTTNDADAVFKARRIVEALPKPWLQRSMFKSELTRLAGHLSSLGETGRGLGPDGLKTAIAALKELGFEEQAEKIRRGR